MRKKAHCTVTRKNILIWRNWSAVPRLRVLFDRRGYTNKQVQQYLINRFGWAEGMCIRDLQYQVSLHKKRSTKPDQIWKVFTLNQSHRLSSEFKIIPFSGSTFDVGMSRHKRLARDRVFDMVRSGRMFAEDDFIDGEFDVTPDGYTRKMVWIGGNRPFWAYVPPYGSSRHMLDFGYGVSDYDEMSTEKNIDSVAA